MYWLQEDPKPELVLGASALLMMFHARIGGGTAVVGMDTLCEGQGFLTEDYCH